MNVQIEVSKEAYELGQGLKNAFAAILPDPKNPTKILAAIVQYLLPALDGVTAIPAEAKADKAAFIRGLALSLEDIAFLFLK